MISCSASGATAWAISVTFIEGIFLTYISPPTISENACHTWSTPCSSVIMKRVMRASVIGSFPLLAIERKNGITDPRDPMTLP